MSALTIAATVPLAAEQWQPDAAQALVVLIPGSGPIDRDGDARGLALGIQRQLAEGLRDHDVASIRWDKRGVGESGGDFMTTGLWDLVNDALAVVDEAINGGIPVVLVGHSEGTAIAARVLVERPAVAGAVLLSPYARNGLDVLRWQARALQDDIPAFVRGILRLMRTDFETQTEKNRQRLLATTRDVERIGGAKINARWFREFMAHNPLDDLTRSAQPVLAIAAEFDLQAPPDDAALIAASRTAPTRAEVLDGLSHILRRQPTATLRSYRKDARRPIDERIVPMISDWINQLVGL